MEEMLVTWRTGGPGGVEPFGQTVQLTISRAIWGDMSSGLSGPTPNQVLIELDVILAQKTRAVDQNPADTESKSQIEVLQQVRLFQVIFFLISSHASLLVAKYGAGDYVHGRFKCYYYTVARFSEEDCVCCSRTACHATATATSSANV